MRHTVCPVVLLALLAGVGLPRTSADEPPPALATKLQPLLKPLAVEPPAKDELTRLLTERHNAAVAYLSERLQQYKRGARDLASVYDGARMVLQARLALADTPEATVRTLEESLDVARLMETYAGELVAKKVGNVAELELARYQRLGLEIDLLKARQKLSK